MVAPALSFSLTDKHSLSVPPTMPPARLFACILNKLISSVARTSSARPWYRRLYLFHSRTNKFVRATHYATSSFICLYPEQTHFSGGTDKFHLSVVCRDWFLDWWHGQVLLVRGSAGSILLAHGQTSCPWCCWLYPSHSRTNKFVRATIGCNLTISSVQIPPRT